MKHSIGVFQDVVEQQDSDTHRFPEPDTLLVLAYDLLNRRCFVGIRLWIDSDA